MEAAPVGANLPLQFGKILITVGLIMALVGLVLVIGSRYSFFGLGRLPGDIAYKGKNISFYFPVITSLVISIVLTLLLGLISWLTKK